MLEQDRRPSTVILVDDCSPLPVTTLLPAACRELSGAGSLPHHARGELWECCQAFASGPVCQLLCHSEHAWQCTRTDCAADSHPSLVVEHLPAARGPAAARNAGLLLSRLAASMGAEASAFGSSASPAAAAWKNLRQVSA